MNLEAWIVVWLQIGAVCLAGGLLARSRLSSSVRKAIARWTFVALPIVILLNVFPWRTTAPVPTAPITIATPAAAYVEVNAPLIANPPVAEITDSTGSNRSWSIGDLLALTWAIGASFPIVRLILGLAVGLRVRRRTLPSTTLTALAKGNPVRVGDVPEPMLAGLIRPTIYLPERLVETEREDRLRAIILHELGHIVGQDLPWRFAARLVTAILWPQPLVRWVERAMIQADEDRCDEEVLTSGISGPAYAGVLVAIAERYRGRFGSADAAAFSSGLKRRVKALLSGRRQPATRLSRRGGALIGLTQLTVLAAALYAFGAMPPAQSPRPQYKPLDHAFKVSVVGVDGKPIEKGEVYAQGSNDDGRTPAAKLSIENGTVQIDPKMWREPMILVTLAAKDARSAWTLHVAWDGQTEQKNFRLESKAIVRGQFLGIDGKPLANQRLVTDFLVGRRGDNAAVFFEVPKSLSEYGRTDAEGRFIIDCFPQQITFLLDCPDYTLGAKANRRIHADQPEIDLGVIRSAKGGVVEGRISQNGKPVSGIVVGSQSMDDWGQAMTDADGRYRITRLPAGEYNIALKLEDPQQRQFTAPAYEGVTVKPGETVSGRDFKLIPGGILRGRVTENGKPKSGVYIGVYGPAHPQSGAWVQGTRTDAKGEYVTRVPAGKQHVYIMEDFGPLRDLGTMADVEVFDGKETRVDLVYPTMKKQTPKGKL